MIVEPSRSEGLTFEWSVGEEAIPAAHAEAVLLGTQILCLEFGPFEDGACKLSYARTSESAFADAVEKAAGVVYG